MHRLSLIRGLLGLLLGWALIAWPAASPAQTQAKPDKVTFDTGDGVTIQGTFYRSPRGRDEPTVILLHKIGSDSHKDGWDHLATKLNEKGYSVLTFDFRGHGNSTSVDSKFWKYRWNGMAVKGGNLDPSTKKPKESINQKDFTPGYLPYLINDIAAAKMFLDDRNDAGECNSRALVLIGAEDAAALGAVWMASEWNRYSASVEYRDPRFAPIIRSVSDSPEGKDQYCALWLTMMPALGGRQSIGGGLRSALNLVGRDKKVPMGFLYGDKDESGRGHAEEYVKSAKGSDPNKFAFTAAQAIKDTKLAGSALLRDSLNTEELILNYLAKVRDKNVPRKWSKVDLDRTGFVWSFNGRHIPAKEDKSKTLDPVPLGPLGIAP
jgi:pimeloyl-ACP methyl ester carboxylesterase